MINVLRSINYGLRRDIGVIVSLVMMFFMPYTIMLFMCAAEGMPLSECTPSYYFAAQNMAAVVAISYVGLTIISCKAMGGDSKDKTINYELLSGHNRLKIFAARTIAGIAWSVLPLMLFSFLSIGVIALINGWGMETDPIDVIIRIALCVFPLIRICALNMMFTSVFNSAGKGIAMGFGMDLVISICTTISEEVFHKEIDYGFGFLNIIFLLTSQNSREVIIEGKPVNLFDTALTPEMYIKTIGFALVFTVAYLLIGYVVFKKKDRD